MKKILLGVLICMPFLACSGVEQDRDVNAELSAASVKEVLYLVEPMICGGVIRKKPADMHGDYGKIMMQFLSFKSRKRDGSWVDSLEVSNDYIAQFEEWPDSMGQAGERWLMGPLRMTQNTVYRNSLSGRDDDLELEIIDARTNKNGEVEHTLKGTYRHDNSVVGPYVYDLDCVAVVVNNPKRRVDLTVSR
jgi:hypothetical protein